MDEFAWASSSKTRLFIEAIRKLRLDPMITRIITASAAIAIMSAGSLALPVAASAATALPKVSNCGEVSVKPSGLVLSCADANTALETLKWSAWGQSTAKATGVFSENDCSPTCVAGTFNRYKANVTLSAPKAINGTKVFTKVRVVFPGITDQSNRTFTLN